MRRAVAAFFRKAYDDNLTGLAAMVAYNLILSVLPLALVALFVAGRHPVLGGRRGLGPRGSRAAVPAGGAVDAARRPAAGTGVLDHRRDPRRDRRRLVLQLVLGRAGHRVLPHLPPRVPLLGAPEAVRARDARRRPALLRRERHHPHRAGHRGARLARPAVRARRRARDGLLPDAASPACWCSSRSSASSTGACRAARSRGAASGRARPAARSRSPSSTTRSRSTSRT